MLYYNNIYVNIEEYFMNIDSRNKNKSWYRKIDLDLFI